MDRTAVQSFNALASATRLALFPSIVKFAGTATAWTVAMGPITRARQQDPTGQGFLYYNNVALEFPRNDTYEPKVGAVFVRVADEICAVDTNWVVRKIEQIPNETSLFLTAERAPQ